MDIDNNEIEIAKELKKALKPDLYVPIWTTIICSGPPLNLIFRYFIERDIKDPTAPIILSVIAMIWTIVIWCWYVKNRNDFKKDWEKISIELHALNYQEEPSKDIIGTIFDILMKTGIASLAMTIVFIGIAILDKLSFLKYLSLFCLLIFFISGGGMIIVSIIQLSSFIRDVIKCGRLKEVLKKFTLIFTLLSFILIIISCIIRKNPEWIKSLLSSFEITLPILIYTEGVMFYKKIKQEYSLNTSPDESDRK